MSERIWRLTAPNAGPFTHTGTCTYLIGDDQLALVDPGPDDARHIKAILHAIKGKELRYILVTHTHKDHSSAAGSLRKATGAKIFGCAPYAPSLDISIIGSGFDAAHDRDYAPDYVLKEGDTITLKNTTVCVVATPGHTSNHLCYALEEEKALFTGDHVMGWSTTVIAPPDGSMRDYLMSLEYLRKRNDHIMWPGHGQPITIPQRYLRAILHHRHARAAAILRRLKAGDRSIENIVENIYGAINPALRRAAAMTVFAHLQDLVERKLARCEGPITPQSYYLPLECKGFIF